MSRGPPPGVFHGTMRKAEGPISGTYCALIICIVLIFLGIYFISRNEPALGLPIVIVSIIASIISVYYLDKLKGEEEKKEKKFDAFGMPRDLIDSIEGLGSSYCGLCYEKIDSEELIERCPNCEVSFHQNHFLEWVKDKGHCPICKMELEMSYE